MTDVTNHNSLYSCATTPSPNPRLEIPWILDGWEEDRKEARVDDDSSMKCRGVETLVHAKARATFGAHFEIALTTREVRKLVSNCKARPVRLGVGLGVRNVVVQELQFVGRGGHRTTVDVPTLVITGHCNLLIHRITVNTHLIEFKLHVIEGARCRINGIDTGVEQFHVRQVGILNQTGEAQG
jgi:hypothetical protein